MFSAKQGTGIYCQKGSLQWNGTFYHTSGIPWHDLRGSRAVPVSSACKKPLDTCLPSPMSLVTQPQLCQYLQCLNVDPGSLSNSPGAGFPPCHLDYQAYRGPSLLDFHWPFQDVLLFSPRAYQVVICGRSGRGNWPKWTKAAGYGKALDY